MSASEAQLVAHAVGEVEKDDGVLVLRRIHVTYRLEAAEADRETIERVHGFHAKFCPVYRSICAAVDITTSLEIVGG